MMNHKQGNILRDYTIDIIIGLTPINVHSLQVVGKYKNYQKIHIMVNISGINDNIRAV